MKLHAGQTLIVSGGDFDWTDNFKSDPLLVNEAFDIKDLTTQYVAKFPDNRPTSNGAHFIDWLAGTGVVSKIEVRHFYVGWTQFGDSE